MISQLEEEVGPATNNTAPAAVLDEAPAPLAPVPAPTQAPTQAPALDLFSPAPAPAPDLFPTSALLPAPAPSLAPASAPEQEVDMGRVASA